MSYIKYRMSYVHQMCIEYVSLMPIYIHGEGNKSIYIYIYIYICIEYLNYIFSFPRGEGNKSLDVLWCRVEGDSGDDGALLTRSLDLLLRLFSRSNWYKESRYESIFIIRWNQIYVRTKSIIFLPPTNSHSVSPPQMLVDDQAWQDPTTIQ